MEKQKVDVALDEDNKIKIVINLDDSTDISSSIELSSARILMAKLGSLIKSKEQGE